MINPLSNPQTMAEKILSQRGHRRVYAGELAVVEVDQVMVVDSIAVSFIERMQRDLVAVPKFPERVSIVIDHVAPASTVMVAQAQKEAREYAARTGVRLFDVGRGICHQVLMEEGAGPARLDRAGVRQPQHHLRRGGGLRDRHGGHRHRARGGQRQDLAARAGERQGHVHG